MRLLGLWYPLHDRTPLEHAAITCAIIAVCTAMGLVAGCAFVALWTGVVASLMTFLGREIAQAEKRGDYPISARGKWYKGLCIWCWDTPSLQDIAWPTVVAAAWLAGGIILL